MSETVIGKTLVLSVKDRLMFGELFPEKGNIVTQLQVRDISERIKIDTAEREELELRVSENGRGLSWNQEKAIDRTFMFSEAEMAFLKGRIDTMDREGNITQDSLSLVQKIKDA